LFSVGLEFSEFCVPVAFRVCTHQELHTRLVGSAKPSNRVLWSGCWSS